jgi:RNA polymerase sigma factor (sigma-70 family)
MSLASASRTSPTLLGRLRQDPADQDAWARFAGRYGPKIHAWCRERRLQEADAQDVTQAVLVRLADKMRHFEYDPVRSFRGWLRVLTLHALSDFWTARKAGDLGTGDAAFLEWAGTLEAREDLAARLEEEYDLEILEEAMARVRLRVPPLRWEAFRLMALEGLSGAEAAGKLGMKVATAFVVRSKVQALLVKEVRRLEQVADNKNQDHP